MAYKLLSVSEMQAIEKEANDVGLTYPMMMENAGKGLAEAITDRYGFLEEDGIFGLVGVGNNGGDTLVALTYLAESGWPAYAYLLRQRETDDPLIGRFEKAGGIIYSGWDDQDYQQLKALLDENAIMLDGILGTGIHLPLRGNLGETLNFIRQKIQEMNESPLVVAVDCPSGIDCDSGEAAPEVIPADLTVTMAAIKQGLFRFPAYGLVGELAVVGIGLPRGQNELSSWKKIRTIVPGAEWVHAQLPKRPDDSHKGTFGTAFIVAGSMNYTGAALLAGKAAYRAGVGLVTLAVPESLHSALAGVFPEATWLLLPEKDGFIDKGAEEIIFDNLSRATSLLAGPGFGMAGQTGEFLERLLKNRNRRRFGLIPDPNQKEQDNNIQLPSLVVDADGLKLLAKIENWPEALPPLSVLTPHPGEMSVLTGLSVAEIQADRIEIALRFSKLWNQIVILKGAFSVIAAPDGQAAVIPVATPALARAGTGDVLAGLIVGLMAQGVNAFPAAAAAAWIHAKAGQSAAQDLGTSASVLAGDVMEHIPEILSQLGA